jgi:hypothetical protein
MVLHGNLGLQNDTHALREKTIKSEGNQALGTADRESGSTCKLNDDELVKLTPRYGCTTVLTIDLFEPPHPITTLPLHARTESQSLHDQGRAERSQKPPASGQAEGDACSTSTCA